MKSRFRYDITLPEEVDNILATDFWMLDHLNAGMLRAISEPVKFTSSVSVYVRSGRGEVEINLISHTFSAPCVFNIHRSQILEMKEVSEDFDACFVVLSKRFTDNLFVLLKDCWAYTAACRQPLADIPENLVDSFEDNVRMMKSIMEDNENPFAYNAQLLYMSSFFYHVGMKCYKRLEDVYPRTNSRLTDQFIQLVQNNFKKERFLDFYADRLGVSSRHLSRTMKMLTGSTAVEWIERYVILEAKVLLKSTNMSIQQISDDLNFPSQSFFGKYFKKNTGVSPKEFRNN